MPASIPGVWSAKYVGDSLSSLVNDGVREATDRARDSIAREAQLTLYTASAPRHRADPAAPGI
jgi:hypothetical protein